MSDDNWFYAGQGQQHGPVSLASLRQLASTGELHGEDLVWSEGMPQWVRADSLAQVAAPMQAQPLPATFVPYAGVVTPLNYFGDAGHVPYAGFWLRFAAYIIDAIALWIPNVAVTLLFSAAFGFGTVNTVYSNRGGPSLSWMLLRVFTTAMNWMYFVLMETSRHQATLGKMACGIIVTDENGSRLDFGRATGRYFGKIVSAVILCIGFMMAGWTQKKQALHDIMAKTLVVRKR